jgi:hypothetical protein
MMATKDNRVRYFKDFISRQTMFSGKRYYLTEKTESLLLPTAGFKSK